MTGKLLLIAVVGYLFGSLSISVFISKYILRDDVRQHGSGNAGATNVARVFGMKAGLITLGGDMLKTAAAGLVGWLLAGATGLSVGCAACLIGHSWPVFFRFRGGKGVSVSACIALLLDWRMFLIVLGVFMLVFLFSRRVSLCSIIASLCFPLVYWLLHPGSSAGFWLCVMVPVLIIFLHRGNIVRLIHGEEPKFRPKHRE